MQEERIWLLVSLKISGEANPDELKELDEFLMMHPEYHKRVEIISALLQPKKTTDFTKTDDAASRHLQRFSNHLAKPALQYETPYLKKEKRNESSSKPVNRSRWFWYSGGMAACFLLIFFLLARKESSAPVAKVLQNMVATKRGCKSKIQLSDGTQVWLNADSKLTYNQNFTGATREVELTGEAYFDVAKDKKHPFIIHTSTIDLKVLGTAFNVRSYSNEKTTETDLFRGAVEITLKNNPGKKIILAPNEKLVVQNNSLTAGKTYLKDNKNLSVQIMTLSKIYIKNDSVPVEKQWIMNKLAFESKNLEDVAMDIERWYNVTVTITDDNLKKRKFSGAFEDETLAEVMDALSLTGDFKYSVNKKEVIIRP